MAGLTPDYEQDANVEYDRQMADGQRQYEHTKQKAISQFSDRYNEYLGRDATDGEADRWVNWNGAHANQYGDQGWLEKRDRDLYFTDEAKNYRKRLEDEKAAAAAAPKPQAQTQAAGSPVTATGQIAPQASSQMVQQQMAPQPTPATRGAEPNQTRYLQGVDVAGAPAYAPTQFVDRSAGGRNALLDSILNNPQTMNPTVIAQLKEQQKEQALLMQRQVQQSFDQSNIAAGRFGSGQARAAGQNLDMDTINAILDSNRGVDIAAMQTNRADELAALTAATQQGDFAQRGQAMQADENFRGNQAFIDKLLKQFDVNQGVAQNAQQNYATDLSGTMGLNAQTLDIIRFIEAQRQHNNQLALGYTQVDQADQHWLGDKFWNG